MRHEAFLNSNFYWDWIKNTPEICQLKLLNLDQFSYVECSREHFGLPNLTLHLYNIYSIPLFRLVIRVEITASKAASTKSFWCVRKQFFRRLFPIWNNDVFVLFPESGYVSSQTWTGVVRVPASRCAMRRMMASPSPAAVVRDFSSTRTSGRVEVRHQSAVSWSFVSAKARLAHCVTYYSNSLRPTCLCLCIYMKGE